MRVKAGIVIAFVDDAIETGTIMKEKKWIEKSLGHMGYLKALFSRVPGARC